MANICVISPKPQGTSGNAVTADRWSRFLRDLGHRVSVKREYGGEDCDLLVALHARKSAGSIERFHRAHPGRPRIVALTGTDLYHDLDRSAAARRSLVLATRIVVLQPLGRRKVPSKLRSRVVVIHQSATDGRANRPSKRSAKPVHPSGRYFDVAVLAHLRPVKDPLRAAFAARLLPKTSRIRVLHAGKAMSPGLERQAMAEEARNPRYIWKRDLSRVRASDLLSRSRLLVLSSRMEGGANVISEAAVAGTPILASRIEGTVGLLGDDYPGYFEVGDTRGLAFLLWLAENEPSFYAELRRRLRPLARLVEPRRERAAWRRLLSEVLIAPRPGR